jgi:protocatechuate 4,5-dioxygenase beta chain/2'-carboxy-2,3-dihydroxybiphenyl 1,2-dioxygenase large subunit/2'-aminobiphenyl-2,3-diol 1,2-dioxygenase large subunit
MGVIAGAFCVSHTALMIRRFDATDAQHRRVHEAFAAVRQQIDRIAPDLLVVVGNDHMHTLNYDCFPQICVGIGDSAVGWGDGGVASARLRLAGDFASQLLEIGIEKGLDLAFVVNPRIDHGFMSPLTLLRPEMDIPIVPVWQNTCMPPLSPVWRAADLGILIRDVVAARPENERVVLLGTGGLSHWVGMPGAGTVNEGFDADFLALVRAGDVDAATNLTNSELIRDGGNGAPEIRNWVTVMAACRTPGTVILYEPVANWGTGIGIARLSKDSTT